MGNPFLVGTVEIVDANGVRVDTPDAQGNYSPISLKLGASMRVTAVEQVGALKRVTVDAAGGSGAGSIALEDHDAFRALPLVSLVDGLTITFQNPEGVYVYSTGVGAGQADDDYTILRNTNVSAGSNGRAYNLNGTVLPNFAALALAKSGRQTSVTIQCHTFAGDGGGGIFNKRTGATTTDGGMVSQPSGASFFWERSFSGAIPLPFYGMYSRARIVTVNATTNLFTTTEAHGLLEDQAVNISDVDVAGAMPGGMTRGTTYYVINSGLTATAFKLSATLGGSVLDVTTTGTGKLVVSTVAGKTANTSAVDAAIDAHMAGGGFEWPDGYWPVSPSVLYWLNAKNISIIGSSVDSVFVFDPAHYSPTDLVPGDQADAFLTFADVDHLTVEGITFIGAADFIAQVAVGSTVTSKKGIYLAHHSVGSKNVRIKCRYRRIEGEVIFGDGTLTDIDASDSLFEECISNQVNWATGASVGLRLRADRCTFTSPGQSILQGAGTDTTFDDFVATAHPTAATSACLLLLESAEGFHSHGGTIRDFAPTSSVSIVQIGNVNGPVRNADIDVLLLNNSIVTDYASKNSQVNVQSNHGEITGLRLRVRGNGKGTKNGGVISMVRFTGTGQHEALVDTSNVTNGDDLTLDCGLHIDSTVSNDNRIRVKRQAVDKTVPLPLFFETAPAKDEASAPVVLGGSTEERLNYLIYLYEKKGEVIDGGFDPNQFSSATCVAAFDPETEVTLAAALRGGGTSPAAVTLAGSDSVGVHVKVNTTGGTRATTTVDVSIDGSATFVELNQSISGGTLAVGGTDIVLSFPNVAYAANNTWDAVVQTHADQSASAADITQASAGLRPIFRAAWRKGRPGIQYDGVDDRLYGANANVLTGCVLYAVVEVDEASADNVALFDGSAASTMVVYTLRDGGPTFAFHWGIESSGAGTNLVTSDSVTTTRGLHLLEVRFGASGTLEDDLVAIGSGNSGAANPSGVNVGGLKGGGLDCAFTCGPFYIFDGPLSDAEKDRLVTNMKARYV